MHPVTEPGNGRAQTIFRDAEDQLSREVDGVWAEATRAKSPERDLIRTRRRHIRPSALHRRRLDLVPVPERPPQPPGPGPVAAPDSFTSFDPAAPGSRADS